MTLTPAGRFVTTCLALTAALTLVGAAAHVTAGAWPATPLVVAAVVAPTLALIAALATQQARQ